MKNMYFKVKKIIRDGIDCIGVVVPYFEERGFDYSKLILSENEFEFVTLSGEILRFRKEADLKTTRIMDEKVKEKINEMILGLKEIYKEKMKIVALNEEREAIRKSLRDKDSNIRKELESIVKAQGYISKREFLEKMNSILNISYYVDYSISNGRLTKIELTKEHDLGKWIRNGDYSFLYLEYDDNVCVEDDYKNDKQLKLIKKNYFKELTTNKVCGYPVKEDFYPQGGNSSCLKIV